jgi:hypothetical protein
MQNGDHQVAINVGTRTVMATHMETVLEKLQQKALERDRHSSGLP